MKVNLGRYDDEEVRELARAVETALAKIRIDDALIIGGGTTIKRHLSATRADVATADYSADPIAANTTATFTITVNGAAVGDIAQVAPNGSPGTLVWSAYVSAANTVTAIVGNATAGDVTPTTRTWRAAVWQY